MILGERVQMSMLDATAVGKIPAVIPLFLSGVVQ